MQTYPIMLRIHGRLAVVVGGGEVGARKARSLRRAGAEVKLICRDAKPPAGLQDVQVIASAYRPALLKGAFLVFACTDDPQRNAAIAADARRLGALVNVADQRGDCDFFLPAVASDGEVKLAVGTGGAAPALAARLRDAMAGALPARIGEFAALLGELRETLKLEVPDRARRGRIMRRLAEDPAYQAFLSGGPQAVRRILQELIDPSRKVP